MDNMLDEFNPGKVIRRRALMPVWFKIFIWIFMVLGSICLLVLIFGIFGSNFVIELYGYTAWQLMTPLGLTFLGIYLLKGVVSYSFWFEKGWAVDLGLLDAVIGFIICLFSLVRMPFLSGQPGDSTFRYDILLLLLYLIQLIRMRRKWREA